MDTIRWMPRNIFGINDYLNEINLQQIRCMKFVVLKATQLDKLIACLKNSNNFKTLTTIEVQSSEVTNALCELIRSVPSITELRLQSPLHGNTREFCESLQKITTLKRISLADQDFPECIPLDLLRHNTADININFNRDYHTTQFYRHLFELLKQSSTLRSIRITPEENNGLLPTIAQNRSLTKLTLFLRETEYDFSALKPLVGSEINLHELEIEGTNSSAIIEGKSLDVLFDIADANTKLTRLSVKNIGNLHDTIAKRLGSNTTLRSVNFEYLYTPNLVDVFKMNTTLTDIAIDSKSYLSLCQSFADSPQRDLKSLTIGLKSNQNFFITPEYEPPLGLCQMLKSLQLSKLELNTVQLDQLDFSLLVEGLNSPKNCVTNLKINGGALNLKDFEILMRGIEVNSKLKKLELINKDLDGSACKYVWNMLLKNKTLESLIVKKKVYRGLDPPTAPDSFADLVRVLNINKALRYLAIDIVWHSNAIQTFLADYEKNPFPISLLHLTTVSDDYRLDILLRKNYQRKLDLIVLYNNIKRCNNTTLPLEMWQHVLSYLIA